MRPAAARAVLGRRAFGAPGPRITGLSVATIFANGERGPFYDPTDITTLFQDAAGTTPVTAAGQLVGRMEDISGNGHHATQAVDGNKPVYLAGGGLDFTGGSKYLSFTNSAWATSGDISFFFAAQLRSGQSWPIVFGTNLTSNGYNVGFGDATARQPRFAIGGGTGGPINVKGTALPLDTPAAYIYQWTNGTMSIVRNGVVEASGARTGTMALNTEGRIGFTASPIVSSLYFYGGGFVNRELTLSEAGYLMTRLSAAAGTTYSPPAQDRLFALGDSTVAEYLGQTAVAELVTTSLTVRTVAVAGHTISQQKTVWLGTADRFTADTVVIQVGLNNVNPAIATAVTIAELQDLVDTVLADVGSTASVFVSQLIPCRGRLDFVYGPSGQEAAAYAKWQAINEAIAGNGSTPITGVDGRITAHVALMGDASDYLLPAYDTGDGIHPTTAGRQVNADAWEAAI